MPLVRFFLPWQVDDFSTLCAELDSSSLMVLVNELFLVYDKVAEDTQITKLRTTSDGCGSRIRSRGPG